MNEKCCICPHFDDKTYKCEADLKNETCLLDAITDFINRLED